MVRMVLIIYLVPPGPYMEVHTLLVFFFFFSSCCAIYGTYGVSYLFSRKF